MKLCTCEINACVMKDSGNVWLNMADGVRCAASVAQDVAIGAAPDVQVKRFEHSNYDYARDDAKFLKSYAFGLSYNDAGNAFAKHRLNEIAMRLETKFYVPGSDATKAPCGGEWGACGASPSTVAVDPISLAKPRDNPIKQPTPTAPLLLHAAAKHMRDRAATYDKPEGERSMGRTVEAFNAITGRDINESEGWLLLALLKMVRSEQRHDPHRDSVEDLIAYSALFGEARLGGK